MSEVKFACPECKQMLEASSELAGTATTCPQCNTKFRIPRELAAKAQSQPSKSKAIVWVVTIGIAVLASVILLLVSTRDTWERDNELKIRVLCEEFTSLVTAGQKSDATEKFKELTSLMGNRRLKDASLAKSVAAVRESGEDIRKEVEKQKNLSSLLDLETEAGRLEQQGDLANAARKLTDALAFIEKNGTSAPEFSTIQKRIDSTKQMLDARIGEQEKEKARIAEEEKAREAIERQRNEEEEKLARIRATIKGGAWLTKRAGNSEIIRGLKIRALKRMANPAAAHEFLDALIRGTQRRIDSAGRTVEFWEKSCRENPDNRFLVRELDEAKAKLEAIKKSQQERASLLTEGKAKLADSYIDVAALYSLMDEERAGADFGAWSGFSILQSVAEATTGIDGTYELQIGGGDFYLHAINETEYSTVEWLIPVKVTEQGTKKVDLYNETAEVIRNKKDSK